MKQTGLSPRVFFALAFLCICNMLACGQNDKPKWDDEEIADVFDGIDVTAALARVEARGVTPYDFGFYLLRQGHPDKAKEWFVAVGIDAARKGDKDRGKYIYGLAWVKWVTGDNKGAIEDVKYVLARKPSPLIRARSLYLLGAVSVDEHQFEDARANLRAGQSAYKALGKDGGQFLCFSMLALAAVYEGNFDDVEKLLDLASQHNDAIKAKGKKPYSMGREYEIISEKRYAQGDYAGALEMATESESAYRLAGKEHLADEVQSKIGFLLLLNGEPKGAQKLASKLWETHHKARDRGRLLAYNSITLMKLSLCSDNEADAADKEKTARAWASSGPGGKALIRLLEWTKEEKKFPCPEWR